MTLKNLLIMGSMVRAHQREQTEKSSEMVTFFVYNHLLFHLFIDFSGSSLVDGLMIFGPFSRTVLLDIFVLCQECAKSWF
jgi:hypothetical protein